MTRLIRCVVMTGMIFFLSVSVCMAGGHRRMFRPLYENNRGIVPYLDTPCCQEPSRSSVSADTNIVIPQQELEIVVPRQTQPLEFQDESILRIPIPEPPIPHVSIPRIVRPKPRLRRIDPSKAPTLEKHVIGSVACPLDLPKGGIVRVCNARSHEYRLSESNAKYFHQQQCWFCENILGGEYVRWEDRIR